MGFLSFLQFKRHMLHDLQSFSALACILDPQHLKRCHAAIPDDIMQNSNIYMIVVRCSSAVYANDAFHVAKNGSDLEGVGPVGLGQSECRESAYPLGQETFRVVHPAGICKRVSSA
jgi:hypothetical protein